MSLWDDVDTEVSDRPPFWDGSELDDGEDTLVTLEEDLQEAEHSQFAPVEALATLDDGDGMREVLFAPSAKTLLKALSDLGFEEEGDQALVSVQGTGVDRYYSAEAP